MLHFAVGLIIIAGVSVGYSYSKKAAIVDNQRKDVSNKPFPESTLVNPSGQTTTNNNPNGKDHQPDTKSTDLKSYSNSQYGFSFDYPGSWKLTENTIKKEVTIDTNDIGGVNTENRDNPQYPSWSITFKATDKTFFTQQSVSTKMGVITYDETLKALMSEGCLKARQFFGNNPPDVTNTSTIKSITYGGSLMSDPAYSNSAILTSNGEIIIVYSQQGSPYTSEIGNQLSKIASSFKLLNGNTNFVPECAK